MLLTVEDLRVSYDNIKALHGISFRIGEGEIVCIIGANGAGKSTTLRAISRLVPVEAGTKMTFMGRNLLKYPADKVVSELGISHVPEGRRLFDNLTVMENLRLATFARKDGKAIGNDLERVFSIFQRLSERQDQKAGTSDSFRHLSALPARGPSPASGVAPPPAPARAGCRRSPVRRPRTASGSGRPRGSSR